MAKQFYCDATKENYDKLVKEGFEVPYRYIQVKMKTDVNFSYKNNFYLFVDDTKYFEWGPKKYLYNEYYNHNYIEYQFQEPEESVCTKKEEQNTFNEFGFETPKFKGEILKEYDDHLIGAVYQNEKYFGTSWTKEGICLQSKDFGYISMNLTPIKKPWYETCKIPCLVKSKSKSNILFLITDISSNSKEYLDLLTPLTNEEIEELKQ